MKIQHDYYIFEQRFTEAIRVNKQTDKKMYLIRRACHLLSVYFDKYTQNHIINKWSAQFNIPEKLMWHYTKSDDDFVMTPTDELKEYLASYTIKSNKISKELIIIKENIRYTYDELVFYSQEAGFKTKNIKILLDVNNKNARVIEEFNPLKELFLKLAEKYNGNNPIGTLTDNLTAYNFGDSNKTDYYQKRLKKYVHKWLCKLVGQTLEFAINDAMLLFIEVVGGKGKSRLLKWLFSIPELKNLSYRIKSASDYASYSQLNNSKLVVDYDELPMTKNKYLEFKSNIAAEDNEFYSKKTQTYNSTYRQLNFIGSTNKGNRNGHKGFMLDNDSAFMRRVIPIELTDINWQRYTKEVDLYQLWGQAAHDIMLAKKNNNKELLYWGENDWADWRAENKKYLNLDAKTLINETLPKAEWRQGRIMSSTAILKYLKANGHEIKLSPDSLGKLLASHGYRKGTKNGKRGWWVDIPEL